MEPSSLLADFLRHALRVTDVRRHCFGPGPAVPEEIITTNRLILILQGGLEYRMEGRKFPLRAGTQFFVPAWVRRVWSVPSQENCEIIWCAFDAEDGGPAESNLFCRSLNSREVRLEKSVYLRLLRSWQDRPSNQSGMLHELEREGELKAMLARFWPQAAMPRATLRGKSSSCPIHSQVKQALRWLADHYHEADALEKMYREVAVTPNYLRTHFHRAMGCRPGAYLQRLRLRHARFLLRETNQPQKQISARVGYEDALYFSRLYRRFWGHPPGKERPSHS